MGLVIRVQDKKSLLLLLFPFGHQLSDALSDIVNSEPQIPIYKDIL